MANRIETEMKPEDRAWAYFKSLVDDEDQYMAFKIGKAPLEIEGSDKGKYFLYNSGRLVRLDEKNPYMGNIVPNGEMVGPDFFSALYVWITQKEAEFKKVWYCGNLSIFYNKTKNTPKQPEQPLRRNEMGEPQWGIIEVPYVPYQWNLSGISLSGSACTYMAFGT